MSKRILSISYDLSLLLTRQLILQQAGYQVASALGFVDAMRISRNGKFDLAIIGHSIPVHDQEALLQAIKKCCRAPVLSLHRSNEEPLPGADFGLDAAQGPNELLSVVGEAVRGAGLRKAV